MPKQRKYHPQDMSPQRIRELLLRYGETQAGIAKSLKVSRGHVYRVIQNQVTSDRVRRAVCRAIRKHPKEVWPSAYLGTIDPPRPGRPPAEESARVMDT